MNNASNSEQQAQLLGHPAGLFTLFFAEMWERFSFYGMRALLVLYMIKGFLEFNDGDAYTVYGAYTALVYMTPFFGGMIADRIIGPRRAVVLGGLLMAAGHLTMTLENEYAFYTALALLIAGNGFFKPNISTMVGSLYRQGSPKRDSGFTIFYMGINLGAGMAPLMCGYIGEVYGWHYGFGLATVGMLTGLSVFVAPTRVTQVLIMAGAIAASISLFVYHPDNIYSTAVNIFVGVALLAAGVTSWIALNRGGLPKDVGAPPSQEKLRRPFFGVPAEWAVYILALVAVPIFALFVSGFAPFQESGRSIVLIPAETIQKVHDSGAFGEVASVVLSETSKPAGLVLFLAGLAAVIYLGYSASRFERVRRQRLYVAFILTFFSMLFWAFFEQAGSSINNFTDRNVDRIVGEARIISETDVGSTLTIQPTQAQLGFTNGVRMFTIDQLDALREANEDNPAFTSEWSVAPDNIGMHVVDRTSEIPASPFQSVNPVCILIFGLAFTALWSFLSKRRLEPNAGVKFAVGLMQLGLGFGALWYGAQQADERGMVAVGWLLLGYTLHTTGELCLSPVGLSQMTKLSPKVLVSTMMGVWFLATAFSQFLAAIIAQFTGVEHGGDGGDGGVPAPVATVDLYGDVFGQIAIAGVISGVICLLLSPLMKKWMHEGVLLPDDEPTSREKMTHH